MLSYPIDEADELLVGKLATAKTSLSNCEEDLEFLREQITVGSHHRLYFFFHPLKRGKGIDCADDGVRGRRWRWRSRGCTTGTWCRSARRRVRRRGRRARRRAAAEGLLTDGAVRESRESRECSSGERNVSVWI